MISHLIITLLLSLFYISSALNGPSPFLAFLLSSTLCTLDHLGMSMPCIFLPVFLSSYLLEEVRMLFTAPDFCLAFISFLIRVFLQLFCCSLSFFHSKNTLNPQECILKHCEQLPWPLSLFSQSKQKTSFCTP